jgi:hypothetical protein
MTALMVVLFLLLLTGALVRTQSGVFALAQASDARVRSRAACQSLYDFCLYQLEHNRNWGLGGFTSLDEVDPTRPDPGGTVPLESRVELSQVEGNVFRGYLTEHDTGFEVEVDNRLTVPGSSLTPTEHVRLVIIAWQGRERARGRARQQAICLLRLAPLFDAAVLSRGNVTMQANQVVFSSKDPFRNEIRGEGDISMPGLRIGRTLFVKHSEDVTRENSSVSEMEKDPTGLLWAGGSIADGGTPLRDDQLARAAEASGGRMVEQSTNRADIYDLQPQNIPQPDFNHDVVVPPGEFRFTRAMARIRYRTEVKNLDGTTRMVEQTKQEPLDVLEYYDPPGTEKPLKVMRSPIGNLAEGEELVGTDITYGSDLSDVPVVAGDRFALDQSYQSSETITDGDGVQVQIPEMGFKNLGLGGDAPVVVDLSARTVFVKPQTRVQPESRRDESLPPSAFELTVQRGPGGDPGLPRFELGNGTNDVVIQADGDISIGTGLTDGLATFISKQGSVTLNPVAQQLHWVEKYKGNPPVPVWVLENEVAINANPDYSGLVIYAEKDVNIANISNADWGVRGFVYARRNFNFEVNGHNATFYGSVVAGNNPTEPGAFRIGQGDRATFIYDPDYLKLLTKTLPHQWTRIEPLVWSEGNG